MALLSISICLELPNKHSRVQWSMSKLKIYFNEVKRFMVVDDEKELLDLASDYSRHRVVSY